MRFKTITISVLFALQCASVGAVVASEVPASRSLRSDRAETEVTEEDEGPPASMTYNFLPEHNVLICCCDKCGSTSLYDYVYRAINHHPWPPGDKPPWRQKLYGPTWNHAFRMITASRLADVRYKFALTRDPIDRLLSAWSSKYACDGMVGHVNGTDRNWMIPTLYRLAGWQHPPWCLSLEDFLDVVLEIHHQGNAKYLDSHIRPQQMECFRDLPASNWTKATPITDPSFVQELGPVLGAPDVKMPHIHRSNDLSHLLPLLTPKVRSMLEEATHEDYLALGMEQALSRWLLAPTSKTKRK